MGSGILFNAARMKEIEDGTITSGLVDMNGDLILTRHDETQVNAGHVRGEDGTDGGNGLSAYEVWLADGNTGTEEDFLEAIKGADGEIGIPAGSIMTWGATGIPTNWLECNGQAVDRELYSDLFAIIGVKYGAGDGSTTFNVPDLRGRVIVGLDSSDSDFDDFGKTGGAKTHVLTIDEMPSHRHSQPYIASSGADQTGSNRWRVAAGSTMIADPNLMSAVGGGQAHNNLQPYGVAKYIIKASGGVDSLSSTVETVLLGRVADLEQWQGEASGRVGALESRLPGVIPSSVSVGSGSATVEDDGTVVFSGASSIAIDGVFDGLGMDTYQVFARVVGSVGSNISTRMRKGGVNITGSVYNYVAQYSANALGPARSSVFSTSAAGFWSLGVAALPDAHVVATFFEPGRPTNTHARFLSNVAASDRWVWDEYMDLGGVSGPNQVQDGFLIIPSAGTIYGHLKVVKIG